MTAPWTAPFFMVVVLFVLAYPMVLPVVTVLRLLRIARSDAPLRAKARRAAVFLVLVAAAFGPAESGFGHLRGLLPWWWAAWTNEMPVYYVWQITLLAWFVFLAFVIPVTAVRWMRRHLARSVVPVVAGPGPAAAPDTHGNSATPRQGHAGTGVPD